MAAALESLRTAEGRQRIIFLSTSLNDKNIKILTHFPECFVSTVVVGRPAEEREGVS